MFFGVALRLLWDHRLHCRHRDRSNVDHVHAMGEYLELHRLIHLRYVLLPRGARFPQFLQSWLDIPSSLGLILQLQQQRYNEVNI
jgi:hypothetical protein